MTWNHGDLGCDHLEVILVISGMFFIWVPTALMFFFGGNPNRILDEAKNISFNATAAFNAYSHIKDSIDEAEKIAQEAKGLAHEATKLVRTE